MTDARTYLAGIKERAEAATAGPWRIWKDNEGSRGAAVETSWAHDTDGADTELITDWCKPADAEFIAHSRTDLPRVADALLAVLALHVAEGNGLCCVCWDFNNDTDIKWPCPTVKAITEALESK